MKNLKRAILIKSNKLDEKWIYPVPKRIIDKKISEGHKKTCYIKLDDSRPMPTITPANKKNKKG